MDDSIFDGSESDADMDDDTWYDEVVSDSSGAAEAAESEIATPIEPGREDESAAARKPSRSASKAAAEPAESAPRSESKKSRGGKKDGERTLGSDEELRICEWEKCGKEFVVKVSGRTAVRRFCSGTCRGRASEARTGKR